MAAHAEGLELEERRPVAPPRPLGRAAHRPVRPRGGRCRPRRRPACRSRGRGRRGGGRRTARAPGVERPQWLFSITNSTGSFHTAARLSASWKSPSLVAPSPVNAAATRRSPLQLGREREAAGHRQHRAEVADHADDALLERAEVEGAVAALREAALAAEQLAEEPRQVEVAPGEDAEVAVHRQDVVAGLERGDDPGGDRLLADARRTTCESRPWRSRTSIFSSIIRGRSKRAVEAPELLGREAVDRAVGRRRTGGRGIAHSHHSRHSERGEANAGRLRPLASEVPMARAAACTRWPWP